MSRLVHGYEGEAVTVEVDAGGTPLVVTDAPVRRILTHHREWIGVLDGEPQRDVWLVETAVGVCELHYVAFPTGDAHPPDGIWLLMRWLD